MKTYLQMDAWKFSSFTDIGEGRKDWLQFLKEQAKQNGQRECYAKSSLKSNSYKGSVKNDCKVPELEVEEKARGDLVNFEQKHLQHGGNSADAASSYSVAEIQHNSQKDEHVEDWGQSSSHNQDMTKAPATPLTALLNTSLSSPVLLLPHGKYVQKYL